MLFRSTLREIKQSFGRFLAILLITALGVGFYAGLKVADTAMLTTMEAYLYAQNFYDYRILSTYGFEAADVAALLEEADVLAAEGAISADIIYVDEAGNNGVLKALSITETVNTILLTEGRYPTAADECLIDARMTDTLPVGSIISVSDTNAEEDAEVFAYTTYTIVGAVQSPLYTNFERGTTSLGSGKVAGFVYLLEEGFDVDYYTEIYVCFDQRNAIYSDAYRTYMDEKDDLWEEIAKQIGHARLLRLQAEAQAEIDDAKAELEEEKADALEELAEAWATLEDAAAEIADAKAEIADASTALDEAEAEIADAKAEITKGYAQIADAKAQVEENEALLLATQVQLEAAGMPQEVITAQLAESYLALSAAKAEIESNEKALQESEAKLADAEQEIQDGRQEIQDALTELAEGEAEYEEGLAEYNDAYAEFLEEIADAEAEIADAQQEVTDMEEPTLYLLGRETNLGYVCFESDSMIVEGIANVFPLFFFLVAALVCMTTMSRMIEEQRTTIGTLKALGYGEAVIMGKYVFYAGSAALLGWGIGYFGGSVVFPEVIWYAYTILYSVDDLILCLDVETGILVFFAAMACSVGATYFAAKKQLREVAAQLMRPKAPKAGKRIFLEYLPFLWKHLSFLQKVSLRNIFRYKKRFFMMVIGIGGCTALLVTGFGVNDSVTEVGQLQYSDIWTYDVNVTLTEALGEASMEELNALLDDSVASVCLTKECSVSLLTDDAAKEIYMCVLADTSALDDFIIMTDNDLNPIDYPGYGQAVLTAKIANHYGIAVGDTITLRDEDMREITVTVTGLMRNFLYNYVYISQETYEAALGEDLELTTLLVNKTDTADAHALSAQLMHLEEAGSVTVSQDVADRLSNMLSSMNYIVVVIILCAAGLAFIVLYNLTNINITERIREIATIKVLGFTAKETRQYVFRENILLSIVGALFGLPLGKLLHTFVMNQIDVDMVAFDLRILPLSYVYSFALTILFALLIGLFMGGKLENISMTESLKSVD